MTTRRATHLLALLAPLMASGCASIIHGTHQEVGISSTPAGATVIIDNATAGTTPVIAKLTRKENHVVRIELPGYVPMDATLTRGVSGWVCGNLVFGGLVGLAIDAIDGGMYKLTPEQVSAALNSSSAKVTENKDGLTILAVLKPESDWLKVAQLQRR